MTVDFRYYVDHRTILHQAYGLVPGGLRGALRRAGPQPHDPKFYSVLYRMLVSPRHERIVPTISQLEQLDLARLRITSMMPAEACAPQVVEAVGDVDSARHAARVIELLVANGVDRQSLGRAITQARDRQQLGRLWERWAARCRFPMSPVPSSATYRAIETGRDLLLMGRRFRNCLARYLPEALSGLDSFGIATLEDGAPPIVVHLRRCADGWEIGGLFLKHNVRPAPSQRRAVSEFLYAGGVLLREKVVKPRGKWHSLRRLTSSVLWDLEEVQ